MCDCNVFHMCAGNDYPPWCFFGPIFRGLKGQIPLVCPDGKREPKTNRRCSQAHQNMVVIRAETRLGPSQDPEPDRVSQDQKQISASPTLHDTLKMNVEHAIQRQSLDLSERSTFLPKHNSDLLLLTKYMWKKRLLQDLSFVLSVSCLLVVFLTVLRAQVRMLMINSSSVKVV